MEKQPSKPELVTFRPLGHIERLLWATSLQGNINSVQAVRISGRFSTAELQAALDAARSRHPLLSAGVTLDADQRPCFCRSSRPVPLRIARREHDGSWMDEAVAEMADPIDASRPPLLRAVLLPAGDTSELLLSFHHCNADGMSILFAFRDILHALAQQPPLPKLPIRPPLEELFVPLRSVGPDAFRPSPVPSPATALPTGSCDRHLRPRTGAPRIHIGTWQLDQLLTGRLVAACRKREVSAHGAICAAVFSAFRSLSPNAGHRSIRCASAINLRKECPPIQDDFGVFMSTLITFHEPDESKNFWQLAASVKEKINDAKQPQRLAAVHAALGEVARYFSPEDLVVWSQQAVSYDVGVTNLGKVNIPRKYNSLEITELWAPIAIVDPSADTVAVLTFADKLSITVTSSVNPREFGSRIVEHLESAAQE
ncbi:MAG: hypothetical protein JO069_03340 [Verrucomicrobia bacterium]|nr:hypothetical protein [Verrucomicrobiota bacterium]